MATSKCLFCDKKVRITEIDAHKKEHIGLDGYGYMWPLDKSEDLNRNLKSVPIYQSSIIAKALNVSKVYIRDEGQNHSGSMKDYTTERAVRLGIEVGADIFTVVSCGNQAFSLAKYTSIAGKKAILFAPASSSKIGILSAFSNVLIIAVRDSIFEDVYRLASDLEVSGVYNANVSNESLISGFTTVSREIIDSAPDIDYIFSGVGNGSYLAGIVLGYLNYGVSVPRIIPSGMKGASPIQAALKSKLHIIEYDDFLINESLIDAAEGSIAIASYSMPQLVYATTISNGFSIGDLLNTDLAAAYELLYTDKTLLELGAIPEPTGIIGLAAALKHQADFSPESRLFISFTGHGVKDLEGIKRLVPELYPELYKIAASNRPDLLEMNKTADESRVRIVDKNVSKAELQSLIKDWM